MKHKYTYIIELIDIKEGNIQVKYTPENPSLVALAYNLGLYVLKDDGTKFTIDELIEFYAPHDKWDAQLTLLEQYDTLLNKTGTVS
jgi:hypothetical protein